MTGLKTKRTFHKLLSKSRINLQEARPQKGGFPARDGGQAPMGSEKDSSKKPNTIAPTLAA